MTQHLFVVVVLLLEHMPFPLQIDLYFFKIRVIFIKFHILHSLKQIGTVVVSFHDIILKHSYLHVFVPFLYWIRIGFMWPTEYTKCVDAWLPKLGHKRHWTLSVLFSWITHWGGHQLLCYDNIQTTLWWCLCGEEPKPLNKSQHQAASLVMNLLGSWISSPSQHLIATWWNPSWNHPTN